MCVCTIVLAFYVLCKKSGVVTCRGDILLFLTGQEEIEATVRAIKEIAKTLPQHCAAIVPCPMYANMPAGQQLKIFRPTQEVPVTVLVRFRMLMWSILQCEIKYIWNLTSAKL